MVNIITGNRDHLVKTLVEHDDVDSIWYFGDAEGSPPGRGAPPFTTSSALGSAMASARDWYDTVQGAEC